MSDPQETIDQIDSSELFESAVSDDPVIQEAPEPGAAAETTEQPRDESGRFAAKTETAPPVTTEAPNVAEAGKDEAHVPSWRLREINEERRTALDRAERAERQFNELQQRLAAMEKQNAPKQEPVDIFADPNAFIKQQLNPFEQQLQTLSTNTTLRLSRVMSMVEHGKEAVVAAEKAVGEAMNAGDPEVQGLRAKMLASDDPVGVAVEWHKSRSLLKETGGDLTAYREKVLEEAMKDPAFQARVIGATRGQGGQTPAKNVIKLPPSLNKIAASAVDDAADNDMSDAGLFAHATR